MHTAEIQIDTTYLLPRFSFAVSDEAYTIIPLNSSFDGTLGAMAVNGPLNMMNTFLQHSAIHCLQLSLTIPFVEIGNSNNNNKK